MTVCLLNIQGRKLERAIDVDTFLGNKKLVRSFDEMDEVEQAAALDRLRENIRRVREQKSGKQARRAKKGVRQETQAPVDAGSDRRGGPPEGETS